MQVNEQVRKGQKGTRLPDMERALDDARAPRGSRMERRGAAESQRTGSAQPSEGKAMPRRYGVGF